MIDVLNQAVCAYDDAVRDGLVDGSLLEALGIGLLRRFERLGDVGDINKAVRVMQDAVHLTPDGHANKPLWLGNLGTALLAQFERLGDLNDLNKALSIQEDGVRLTPNGHPDKQVWLNNLGNSLLARFERLGDLDDLNKSVSIKEEAVHLTPHGHPDKPSRLNNLASSLARRFERLGDLDDLNKAVSGQEDAVHLTPNGHPDKPSWLNNLGTSLVHCFERLGDLNNLNKAVSILEDAVSLTPDGHPDKPSRLNNLGKSLACRFERLGDLDDLNKAVSLREDAVRLTPDAHPDKPSWLNNLGTSLFHCFERLGDLNNLNKAVSILQDAVSLTPDGHPDKPSRLNNLGKSLACRFERLGDLDDLNKAVSLQEDAVRLTPDAHPDKPSRLTNFGRSLACRFERLGDLDNLNKAVSLQENAVCLTPDGHPEKPFMLIHLGNSFLIRFGRLGNLDDLNKSVSIQEDAVRLTPDGHPDKPLMLSNLGNSLAGRFERLGDLDNLNKAVSIQENVLRLTPDGHPHKPLRLNNLGTSLVYCFERLGDLNNLNKAVSILEDAVSLTPDGHPDKQMLLKNLGNSLLTRFQQLGEVDNLNKAVSIQVDVVHLTPDGHPDKPSRLNNLGSSLARRFERLGDLDDLNKAVSGQEDAVRLTPNGHPKKPLWLNNLGDSFSLHFQQLGDHTDLQQAISAYDLASHSTTGPAWIRFHAAAMWALHARIGGDSSLMEAYYVALNLLPELAWLGLSITDRHHHLMRAGKVVRDAAAAAIDSDQAEKAVEWLEQGRSVIWGQLLNLRSPVDALKHRYPELANQLLSLSIQLEGSGTRESEQEPITSGTQPSLQSVADRAHQNALEREQLLKKIRSLDGFTRFLLPKPISELAMPAKMGPVVILNTSDTRSDALVLMPGLNDEVLHIPLPRFTPQDAENIGHSVHNLVHQRGRSDRLTATREGQLPPEEEFAKDLSELWLQVARPVLDGLAMTAPAQGNLPHIWWCPTGPLLFLPIHAAGLYGSNDALGSKLSDFVISSYTPSLTALMEASRAPSKSQKALQLLAVVQPSALGQTYIPGTQKEIMHIERLALGKAPVVRLEADMATVDQVQKWMRDSKWVHFACHGVQDVTNPTESALLLAGRSRLTLSKIIQMNLPHADLAFLSACQTATGDKSLQEESVHLAAGMLLAGYRGVIATMWTIADDDAPQVASDVYEHLFKTSPPDSSQAAEALQLAVQKLRDGSGTRKSFFHWVPFIHVGV
ncbi:TPR-like protein [Mycena pura]|uniref:TPR-like protein n=1 Tax=Mycena pura TaxID=153505 RepID=A0AAD6VPJ6_9AGAR|nr:TPR-like protein [Mycena pura]